MSHLTACAYRECPKYEHRYSTRLPYCDVCGQSRRPIQVCCSQEELSDTGYCAACGTLKQPVRFVEQEVG